MPKENEIIVSSYMGPNLFCYSFSKRFELVKDAIKNGYGRSLVNP